MSLEKYNKKRKFDETTEPKGKEVKDGKELIFVIQRHEATRLHYDFRLELDGVLKSWAVPKGPSLNPADKRLAVMVEDHPVPYANFEGDIPEGNYGAGHVDIWDNGTYEPVDAKGAGVSSAVFSKSLAKGNIRFRMKGLKIQGIFYLRRMGRNDDNWLLIKSNDEYATDEDYDAENVKGAVKPLKKAEKKKPQTQKRKDTRTKFYGSDEKKFKEFIKPMFARLHDKAFDDKDWIFEIKWDGYRAIAETGKKQRLYSRNGLNFENDYPAIYLALKSIEEDTVIDGEIVALDENGNPSFQTLQGAKESGAPICYYVFDFLYFRGKSLEDMPLIERKDLLKELLKKNDPLIRYCDHVDGRGKDFFEAMQRQGLEGMIAKRKDSPYTEGGRTEDWLKVKHLQTDEAIIVGYTAPKGSRQYFGALLLAIYEDDELKYIGHTGTGFDHKTLAMLYDKMQPLITKKSPFKEKVRVNGAVTWLTPKLVCNIKFTEKTADGARRHPVFTGLRHDKSPKEVNHADAMLPKNNPADAIKKVGGHNVKLTNLEKVYFPDEGYTKGDVIRYYDTVSKYILKYLKNRPLSLLRNPNGIKDKGFFHKDAGDDAPEWVETKTIWSDSSERDIDYIVCNNKATLLYLANLGCIEFNPWHSRLKRLEYPDYLLLDLDPSDKNTFEQVIETARAVKEILDKAGAESWCKTSGSTGLHICVPMGAKYTYEQVITFAEIIATRVVNLLPDITSVERSLKKRGDAIYIDYMQNRMGQTVACPYSLRPKPGATASAPLDWKEVKKGLTIDRFDLKNMNKRIEAKGDLFAPVLGKGIDMAKCLKKLEAEA